MNEQIGLDSLDKFMDSIADLVENLVTDIKSEDRYISDKSEDRYISDETINSLLKFSEANENLKDFITALQSRGSKLN